MRLLYITVSFPFGTGEAFLFPEANELLQQGHQMVIVPRSPQGTTNYGDEIRLIEATIRRPLISWEIIRASFVEFCRCPMRAFGVLAMLFRSRNTVVLSKNLAVLPKAFWLASLVRRREIEHIHAHWALTTATMAMIASHLTGVPWSLTAHRGDIAEDNLLKLKVDRAAFTRFISKSGLLMARSLGARVQPERTHVIPMGVALPEFLPVTSCPSTPAILMCPANLLPVKGHQYLLRAVGFLRERAIDVHLNIAGQGFLHDEFGQASEIVRY